MRFSPSGFPLPNEIRDVAAAKNRDDHHQVFKGGGRYLVTTNRDLLSHTQGDDKEQPEENKDPASHLLTDLAFDFVDDLTQGIKDKEDKIEDETKGR